MAIGKGPSEKIFKDYCNLELKLANLDRCRKINEKFLQVFPNSSAAWIHFAKFESDLDELDRSR